MQPTRFIGELHVLISPEMRERLEGIALEQGVSLGKATRCVLEKGLGDMK